MKITVGESAGSSNCDFHLEGLGLPSFNDLRFTNSGGTTLLDYWIESLSGTTPNQTAIVWVEFDSIGTTDTTFYCYYGNSGASAVSSGTNTFLLFDDFNSSIIDTNIWTVSTGSPTQIGSVLTAPAVSMIYSNATFGVDKRITCLLRFNNNNAYAGFGFQSSDMYGAIYQANYPVPNTLQELTRNPYPAESSIDLSTGYANAYHIFEVARQSDSTVHYLIDGTYISSLVTNIPTISLPVCIDAYGQNIYVEWIYVSQYLVVEPTWGTWGEQEQAGVTYNRTCLSSFNISLQNLASIIPVGPQSLNRSCSSAFSFNDIGAATRPAKEFDKSSRVGLVFQAHTRIWKPYALAHLSFNATSKRFTYSAKPGRE
jgi:hypothetical protein